MAANLPYSFIPGTKARAQEVNANFSAVMNTINTMSEKMVYNDFSNLSQEAKDYIKNSSAKRNIGEIIVSAIPIKSAEVHLLDGSIIQNDGLYKDFVDYIAQIYNDSDNTETPKYFCSEEDWQKSVTKYGVCAKFVYDSENGTVRLPKISGIVEGTTDEKTLGDLTQAGLPNITGNFVVADIAYNENLMIRSSSGAFTNTGTINSGLRQARQEDGNYSQIVYFDAARSSSLYKNNFNKVQPQTVKLLYYIVIASSSKTDVEVDFDNLSQELNDRADTCASNFNSTGKTNLSSFGMPSGKCITLTAGASGTKYTAPANGWVSFCVEGNANGLFGLNNLTITDSARISTFIPAPAKGVTYRTFMPIMKNSEFSIEFYNSITPQWLVFIYAQGEV